MIVLRAKSVEFDITHITADNKPDWFLEVSPHGKVPLLMVGQKVLHQKFGAGKVLSIDGGRDKRVATIFFQDVEHPQKRLMLNFAKLQILN